MPDWGACSGLDVPPAHGGGAVGLGATCEGVQACGRVLQPAAETAWACLQGPKDIHLGMTGAVLGTIPTAFLYFSTYEWCKDRLTAQGHSQVKRVWHNLPPLALRHTSEGSCEEPL